jgi:hypothetical protein
VEKIREGYNERKGENGGKKNGGVFPPSQIKCHYVYINIYCPHFLMPLPKIPSPFHAIVTSSSNKLHASSMNNHF